MKQPECNPFYQRMHIYGDPLKRLLKCKCQFRAPFQGGIQKHKLAWKCSRYSWYYHKMVFLCFMVIITVKSFLRNWAIRKKKSKLLNHILEFNSKWCTFAHFWQEIPHYNMEMYLNEIEFLHTWHKGGRWWVKDPAAIFNTSICQEFHTPDMPGRHVSYLLLFPLTMESGKWNGERPIRWFSACLTFGKRSKIEKEGSITL